MLQKTLGFLEKPWVFTCLYHDFTYHETEKPWKFTGYHEKNHRGSVLWTINRQAMQCFETDPMVNLVMESHVPKAFSDHRGVWHNQSGESSSFLEAHPYINYFFMDKRRKMQWKCQPSRRIVVNPITNHPIPTPYYHLRPSKIDISLPHCMDSSLWYKYHQSWHWKQSSLPSSKPAIVGPLRWFSWMMPWYSMITPPTKWWFTLW